jgi:hypothetical protein
MSGARSQPSAPPVSLTETRGQRLHRCHPSLGWQDIVNAYVKALSNPAPASSQVSSPHLLMDGTVRESSAFFAAVSRATQYDGVW